MCVKVVNTFCIFFGQTEPNVAPMAALIQKLHLCINQLEQVSRCWIKKNTYVPTGLWIKSYS